MLLLLTDHVLIDAQAVLQQKQKVRVGVFANEPKIFMDDQGKPDGFLIDLLEVLAERLDLELVYVELTWSEALTALEEGRIDILPDGVVTSERAERFCYAKVSVIENWAGMFAHEDLAPNYYTLQDLPGHTIAVLADDDNWRALKDRLGANAKNIDFVVYDNYAAAVTAIINKQVDMALLNIYYGMYNQLEHPIHDLGIVVNPAAIHMAGNKQTATQLLKQIDYELVKLKRDEGSAYYRLIDKWLTADNFFRFPTWLSWVLASLSAVLAMLVVALYISYTKQQSRKKELKLKHIDLSHLNQELDHFTYQISHHMRGPVASCLGLLKLHKYEGAAATPLLVRLTEQIELLDSFIQEISFYYHNLRSELQIEPIQLKELVAAVYQEVRQNPALKVQLLNNVPEEAICTTDKYRLKAILHNLINNSIRYARADAKPAPHVVVKAVRQGTKQLLIISDNGTGIEPLMQQKVFDMFSRATGGAGGTGLGLYLVAQMAAKLNVELKLQSVPGEGTTVEVWLPCPNTPE